MCCGGLRPLAADGVAEIKRMFVSARARGRGHGRALLRELERRAAASGRRRVRLFTTEVLVEARALYASAGYEVVGTVPDGARTDLWLEKPAAPPTTAGVEQSRSTKPRPSRGAAPRAVHSNPASERR